LHDEILPPSDDYVLKAILTHPDAKPALMDLISTVICRMVKDVLIRNNELPSSDTDEKNERLDINCVIDDGSQVDVEMQGSKLEGLDGGHDSFINKTVYYLTDLHSSQKSKGIKYVDFVRMYQIAFSAHDVFKGNEYVTEASFRTQSGIQITDQVNMVIIELSKLGDVLNKPVGEMTSLEMWSAFLGYASDLSRRKLINEVLERKEAIGMAASVLATISKDEHERAKFMSRRKFESDMTSNILTAEARGETKGRLNEKMEIAMAMKAEGMPIDTIARLARLPVSDIEKL
jgi:predicted transposase/invertase (TIGR01784 family)